MLPLKIYNNQLLLKVLNKISIMLLLRIITLLLIYNMHYAIKRVMTLMLRVHWLNHIRSMLHLKLWISLPKKHIKIFIRAILVKWLHILSGYVSLFLLLNQIKLSMILGVLILRKLLKTKRQWALALGLKSNFLKGGVSDVS